MAAGLGIGLNSIMASIVGTLIICVLIFVLHKSNWGGLRKFEYVLNFKMDAKHHSNEVFKGIMEKYLKKQALLNVDAKDRGQILMFTFNISLLDDDQLNEFINEMNGLEGVSDVNIVSSKNDLEF